MIQRQVHHRGRQAVAGGEAVGHEVGNRRPHRPQAAQPHGAGGGAVAVVVGHDEQPLAARDGIGQRHRRLLRALELLRRQQPRQRGFEFIGLAHPARGEKPRQQGMRAGGLQPMLGAGVGLAFDELHGPSKGKRRF
ncbi:hypothetical protein GALL_466180 [mine drainage metagenome]|uniref:Uncharacterized protein n=1 Tax=mine drainage metagenome TaxID=410659 RepID=A0A1J5PJL4_9ZZZZ